MARKKKQRTIKAHHAKPYRKRHVGLSAIGITLLTLSAYALGFGFGRSTVPEPYVAPNTEQQIEKLLNVDSSLGFSFSFEERLLKHDEEYRGNSNSTAFNLGGGFPINEITLSPVTGKTSARDLGSSLKIEINDSVAVKKQLAKIESLAEKLEYSASISEIESEENQALTLQSSEDSFLGGRQVTKNTYRITSELGGNLPSGTTYAVVWSGIISDSVFAVTLEGLVGDDSIPTVYSTVFSTLNFNSDAALALGDAVEKLSNSFWGTAYAQEIEFDEKFLADSVSPGVVKIYLGYCGTLAINQTIVADEYCGGGTGSGFIISDDGYVATNGHVVIFEAEDYLIDLMLSSEQNFIDVLDSFGFTAAEINQVSQTGSAVAGLISAIYETDEGVVEFLNEEREIWVATGSAAPDFSTPDAFFSNDETRSLKQAELIDVDYAAQDYYTTQLDPEGGFTSSDVALLKIDIEDAPKLSLSQIDPIQNEDITVIGFPGDAENPLVDTDEVVVSTTQGAISSIRNAAGSSSKLFQSDVDASQGNSGGPAINSNAQVIGLLTYRYKNEVAVDASKSYIRDVEDLRELAVKNDVELDGGSATQVAWDEGLKLFGEGRYSLAKDKFKDVKLLYPQHRLANDYIQRAQAAIDAGLDVSEFPTTLAIVGALIGFGSAGMGIRMIVVHNHMHKQHLVNNAQKQA